MGERIACAQAEGRHVRARAARAGETPAQQGMRRLVVKDPIIGIRG